MQQPRMVLNELLLALVTVPGLPASRSVDTPIPGRHEQSSRRVFKPLRRR